MQAHRVPLFLFYRYADNSIQNEVALFHTGFSRNKFVQQACVILYRNITSSSHSIFAKHM